MRLELVFETHSLSEDNGRGIATGWNDGHLSQEGRALAQEMRARRSGDRLSAVFSSDLGRAIETAHIAAYGLNVPILLDWRLRECDYGQWNGADASRVHENRRAYLDQPYPNGESWRQATRRVARFIDDLLPRWEGKRVLVVGHVATLWGLEQRLQSASLEAQIDAPFQWREGWEFTLGEDELLSG